MACVQPSDLLVFSSAALHFASNDAAGMSAALYHGILTRATLPRLQAAAAHQLLSEAEHDGGEQDAGAPGGVLSAVDLMNSLSDAGAAPLWSRTGASGPE